MAICLRKTQNGTPYITVERPKFRTFPEFLPAVSPRSLPAARSTFRRLSTPLFFSAVSLFVGRMARRRFSPICGAFTEAGPNNGPAPLLSPTPVTIFTDILAFRQAPGSIRVHPRLTTITVRDICSAKSPC